MAHNEYRNQEEKSAKKQGILELDTHSALMASKNLMINQFKEMYKQLMAAQSKSPAAEVAKSEAGITPYKQGERLAEGQLYGKHERYLVL